MIANESLVLYVLIGLFVILLAWMIRLEMRLKKMFKGTQAKDLEGIMTSLNKEVLSLKEHALRNDEFVAHIDSRVKRSIQGIETIRFNPFKDQGGNQSFAIGFMNEEGDGVVVSSLYSRDRMSVFAKPVKKLKSEFELTEEEQEVITKSLPK